MVSTKGKVQRVPPKKPPVDNPIKGSDDDVLGRALVAGEIVETIHELDHAQGLVVAILGAWGHGKTSFVNLMKESFAAEPTYPTVEFNPWLFSGSQNLSDVFLREIAAELRIKNDTKLEAIASGLESYGDVLSPLAIIPWFGAWWDRTFKATKVAAAWWSNRRKGSRSLRQQVSTSLLELEQPIVVVVDDIDRLTTEEIRDIFKLVRVTASFPNIIYLLAFDRRRVEKALDEAGVTGRAYLEKIVQLSFDLPAIPRELLRTQVFERLNPLLDGVADLRFDTARWSDVYFEVIEPLVGSLRDASRLAVSSRTTVRALGSQIETVDLLALEAIRVFRPEIFEAVLGMRATLSEVSDAFSRRDTSRQKAEVDHLLEVAGTDNELVRNLLRRVFPAARQYIDNYHYGPQQVASWRREHRLAHSSYLQLYFERTAPKDLTSFALAEKAYLLMTDQPALTDFLDGVPPNQLEDVISGLEAFEDEYPVEAVVPATVALMNYIDKIPQRDHRSIFDIMRPDIVVGRVVVRLLRRVDDEAARESAVREILSRLRTYSSQWDLVRTVGHREGAGHKFVSEQFASKLEAKLAARIQAEDVLLPSEEWDLLRVYYFAAEHFGENWIAPPLEKPDLVRSLLWSARSIARVQSEDSRAVREEERLAWDGLIRIAGSEAVLKAAIDRLREADGDTPLVALADKYLAGWRPKEF